MLFEKEHIEYLKENIKLIVSDEHTFGTDAILLAWFARAKGTKKVCDLGTGCGIIPFYWVAQGVKAEIEALDVQAKAIKQLERSIEISALNDRIKYHQADLRNCKGILPFGVFDLVTMNPPYTQSGGGVLSTIESRRTARHEVMCTLDDATMAASKLLRFGGRFCICIRPERLCDAVISMKKVGIEPKRMQIVSQRADKSPWLLLIEGKLGAKPGLIVAPGLFFVNEKGEKSRAIIEIFGGYNKVKDVKKHNER